MYKLTLILFALFSIVLPILAVPVPVEEAKKRGAFSGKGTWYETGLGSCGNTNTDDQFVVAMSQKVMNSGNCGKTVQITHGSKTVKATVEDTCEACGANDLDMTPNLFSQFADQSVGVISITWVMD